MNARELIAALQTMPPEAEVCLLVDGSAGRPLKRVWLGRGGRVVVSQKNAPTYYDEDRPEGAPTHAEDWYWGTEDDG